MHTSKPFSPTHPPTLGLQLHCKSYFRASHPEKGERGSSICYKLEPNHVLVLSICRVVEKKSTSFIDGSRLGLGWAKMRMLGA